MESNQRRKSGINLPPSMSETPLRLENFSASPSTPIRNVSNLLASPRTMSPRTILNLSSPSKSGTCSDRFIPCRSSSRLHTFGLIEKASPMKEGGGNEAYSRLLRTELFGSSSAFEGNNTKGSGSASPVSPNSKNMLRFRTENSGPNSPYSSSILGQDSGVSSESSTTPHQPVRKVPKTPHKRQSSKNVLPYFGV